MNSRRMGIAILAFLVAAAPATAIELKMKYKKDQTRRMDVKMDLKGQLDIQGDFRMTASSEGTGNVAMDLKVLDVDQEGIATVENRLSDLNVDMAAQAEIGKGTHAYTIKMNENGGSLTADGITQVIPPMAMDQAKAQSWTVRVDPTGAQVGMKLDSEELGAQEAEEIQNLSDSISELLGNNGILPKENVEVGQTWEQVFKVNDLAKRLAKENPMLPTVPELGIPDLKTKYTLTEVGREGDNEMATISSSADFAWKDGKLALGFVNLGVNNLSFKTESLIEMNNTEGYTPRMTGMTTIEFDLAIDLLLVPGGPGHYDAKGQLRVDSIVLIKQAEKPNHTGNP